MMRRVYLAVIGLIAGCQPTTPPARPAPPAGLVSYWREDNYGKGPAETGGRERFPEPDDWWYDKTQTDSSYRDQAYDQELLKYQIARCDYILQNEPTNYWAKKNREFFQLRSSQLRKYLDRREARAQADPVGEYEGWLSRLGTRQRVKVADWKAVYRGLRARGYDELEARLKADQLVENCPVPPTGIRTLVQDAMGELR